MPLASRGAEGSVVKTLVRPTSARTGPVSAHVKTWVALSREVFALLAIYPHAADIGQ